MTVLYIEPRPGNGNDYLRNTILELKKEGYSPTLVGHGYPPIYVDVEEKLHPKIKAFVEKACKEKKEEDDKEKADEKNGDNKEKADEKNGDNKNKADGKNGNKVKVEFCTPEESDNQCHSNMTNFEDVAARHIEIAKALAEKRKEEAAKAAAEKKYGTEESDAKNTADGAEKPESEVKSDEPDKYVRVYTDPQPHLDPTISPPPIDEEPTKEFDVFLAHNSKDKPVVEAIGQLLEQQGITTWIDKNGILAGESFYEKIQEVIPKVNSALMFIGPHGLGEWQKDELAIFLQERKDRESFVLIPVLLPGIDQPPKDQKFLRILNWVSFSSTEDQEALNKLLEGIRRKEYTLTSSETSLSTESNTQREDKEILSNEFIKELGSSKSPPVQNNEDLLKQMDLDKLSNVLMSMTNFQFDKLCLIRLGLINHKTLIRGNNIQERALSLITHYAQEDKEEELIRQVCLMMPNRCREEIEKSKQ
ncbi:toll/interleukin-1 receptor domain-containing protein [Anaerolineales bacterium HSG6]|nr:toll/interleukin-1 receptor domain-containing protein [Anaerolineales bacterium HSG6]